MKVALDLDGVLVDFVNGAARVHDRMPINYNVRDEKLFDTMSLDSYFGFTPSEFWKPLSNFDFWNDLQWTPDGPEILNILENAFGDENICIVTSPSLEPQAAAGKMSWIQREMPDYARRFLIGASKHFCAHPRSLIVDDLPHNTRKFLMNSGNAFLVPRPWNDRCALDPVKTLKEFMGAI